MIPGHSGGKIACNPFVVLQQACEDELGYDQGTRRVAISKYAFALRQGPVELCVALLGRQAVPAGGVLQALLPIGRVQQVGELEPSLSQALVGGHAIPGVCLNHVLRHPIGEAMVVTKLDLRIACACCGCLAKALQVQRGRLGVAFLLLSLGGQKSATNQGQGEAGC